jgi:murein L,D-transpeptidase YafK
MAIGPVDRPFTGNLVLPNTKYYGWLLAVKHKILRHKFTIRSPLSWSTLVGTFNGLRSGFLRDNHRQGKARECSFVGSVALKRSPFVRTLLATAAIAAAIALAGCNTDGNSPSARSTKPLSAAMVAEIEQKNMSKESPILVRIFKQEAELEVWKEDRTGRYALLKTYPICRWSGDLGPKIKEGDRQAPEGFYTITPGQMNPNSSYYLAFNMGYPNAYDRAWNRTGSQLMVHGDCSSRGCYAMTDEQISEIYALGRESFFGGQRAFQIQAYPFHMTPTNMAKHRNSPHMAFWKMIKRGYDHFEVTHLEPKVDVCEKRYVFDAKAPANASQALNFSPAGKCPVFEIPEDIAQAVEEKQRRDEMQTAELVSRGTPAAPIRMGVDGGMNPVFANALKNGNTITDADGNVRAIAAIQATPGTIPAHVNPPREPGPETTAVASTGATAPRNAPATARPAGNFGLASAESKPAPTPAQPKVASADRSGSLFGGMFSDDKKDAKKSDEPGVLGRMGRMIGLSDEPEKKTATPLPPARPTSTASAAPGAIRPQATKPAEIKTETRPQPSQSAAATPAAPASSNAWPEPAKPAAQNPAAFAAKPQPKPFPMDEAPAKTATNSNLSGSAAVVPTGSFSNRWGDIR